MARGKLLKNKHYYYERFKALKEQYPYLKISTIAERLGISKDSLYHLRREMEASERES